MEFRGKNGTGVFDVLREVYGISAEKDINKLREDVSKRCGECIQCRRKRNCHNGVVKSRSDFRAWEWDKLSMPHRLVVESVDRARASRALEIKNENQDIAFRYPFHMIGSYSNLTSTDLKKFKLESVLTHGRPYIANALELIKTWDPDSEKGLYLHGEPRTGKSMLLKGLCLKWAAKGRHCQFWPLLELMAEFKKFDMGSPHLEHIRAKIINANILVLDDFGTEGSSEFVEGELFRILDKRVNGKGSTFFTSNVSPAELGSRYSRRILARIVELVTEAPLNDEPFRRR